MNLILLLIPEFLCAPEPQVLGESLAIEAAGMKYSLVGGAHPLEGPSRAPRDE